MRILHTSDWHLGQNFYTKSRAAEHQAFCDWLLEMVQENTVDAIIVAGDIFDTGTPPSYARELYNRFIVRLQSTGCALYILAGNHDSVATLNESRELLACLNTQVIAAAAPENEPPVITIPARNGEPGALLCPIPFLRPRDIMRSEAGLSGHEKQRSLLEAISDYYQRSYRAALEVKGARPLPIIATGHLTTVGAATSEAVRDIYIGSLDAFPAQAFPPADYIALGHIHRAQKVGGCDHIRYSGSPIALSFDETGPAKSVNLVEFSAGKLSQVTELPVPVTQRLATLRGTLPEIERQLEQWPEQSNQPPAWLDIEIASDSYLNDALRDLRTLSERLPVEILLMRRARAQRQAALTQIQNETLSELKPGEVFERRLAESALGPEQTERLRLLFNQTLACLNEEPRP
ncbi:nuclease SbcCD subunit D [Salmonella enterica subsp. enterica serovar Choleraesuis]|nr:nuclease SbcCD subunit D [Salmonella enterica subsp. enterica serovar Choleraesuis]